MDKKSFRIQTTPNDGDKYITVNLDQNYDCLEILSLKISQDKIYKDFSADYGVLVGRVIANGGYGIPNAKVSIFVPLTDDDSSNQLVTNIYPYTTITDTTPEGVRYNLISPKNFSAGTFPVKQQILDNDTYLEIYETYFKYTTVTNTAGDYMIFGIPIGQQVVHMDTDLSDIGTLSFTADSMVANGLSPSLFVQEDGNYKFKGGNYLDQLPQIISNSLSVDIKPLWGDVTTQQIGISRMDFNINILVSPVAYFTFAIGVDEQHLKDGIYDGSSSQLNGSGGNYPGYLGRLSPNTLQTIKAYQYDDNDNELAYDPTSYRIVSTGDDINKGIYMLLLPCELNKVVTDGNGNIVLSGNDNGIGTSGKWRIEVYSNVGTDISNFLLQKNGTAQPFEVRSGRVYSVKMRMFDAYTLRNDGYHNIYNSLDEEPMFNQNDWLNGFLYFGFAQFNSANSDYASWLIYQDAWYNVETRIIDVTDYLPNLISGGEAYVVPQYNIVTFTDAELPPNIVANLKADNALYGDSNSSYQPDAATSFNGKYVFFKGIQAGWDCFQAMQDYIGNK